MYTKEHGNKLQMAELKSTKVAVVVRMRSERNPVKTTAFRVRSPPFSATFA